MSGHHLAGGNTTQHASHSGAQHTSTPAAMRIDMPALPDELTPEQEAAAARVLVAYVLALVGCAAALGFVLGFTFQKLA